MPAIDFIGPSYSLRSRSVDCQSTVNMYPDINETGKGKSNLFFTGTPGLKKIIETKAKVRALFVNSKNKMYTIEGQEFCEYTSYIENSEEKYIRRAIGGITTTDTKVSIAENGFYIGIVDGESFYIYSYEDDTFTDRTPEEDWINATEICYYDTYFVFTKPNSQQFYITTSYFGAVDDTIDLLDFASKENFPDNIVTTVPFASYLWLMGERSIQIMYNSGDTFPIGRMSGGSFMVGLSAKASVAVCNSSMFWLGRDEDGVGMVFSSAGGTPGRVSNFAVENFLQSQDTISDATAFSYQEQGHYFYCVNFPTANTTWCLDLATKMWHERRYLKENGETTRHRAEHHVLFNNKHFVSDFELNKIYHMSLEYLDDDGAEIRRLRRSPHLTSPELMLQNVSEFQLDMQVGSVNSNDAQIYLRFSKDGGETWSDYRGCSLGKVGEYNTRLIWRRFGVARDIVWEISTSEKISFTLLNAYVRQ